MWKDLSMALKADVIKLGVLSGITDLSSIRNRFDYNLWKEGIKLYKGINIDNDPTYDYEEFYRSNPDRAWDMMNLDSNTYTPKSRKFDGGGYTKGVNYYNPITGENYGDTIPEGMIKVRSFNDLTPLAQDEYMANRPTLLDELVVYPKNGKGAKSTNIGSYYDAMNTLTELNRLHAERLAMLDALVRETSAFEKPLNFLSPGLWFGASIDYLLGETPSFWLSIYDGNSGWVPDNIAEKYPRVSALANMAIDAAFTYGINKVNTKAINTVNKYPDLVAKLRHPTYKKYYHGTAADFNIKDARIGSLYNLGLHASDSPKIANSMKTRGGSNPHIEVFYGQKPSTESIDIYANDINLLSRDYRIKSLSLDFGPNGYDAAGDNTVLFDFIKKSGGNPYMIEGSSIPKYNVSNDVSLNLRELAYPKVKNPKIDLLLREYNSISNNTIIERETLPLEKLTKLSEINAEAAKILSDNGYKVIKYNNVNPMEGGGGASYIITDPSILYLHIPFQLLPSLPHLPVLISNLSNRYDQGSFLKTRNRIRSILEKRDSTRPQRINTRLFLTTNTLLLDRSNTRLINQQEVLNRIEENKLKAVAYLTLVERYPLAAADGMDYEGLANLDASVTPISFNGKIYTGGNYLPQLDYLSQDNRTNYEQKNANSINWQPVWDIIAKPFDIFKGVYNYVSPSSKKPIAIDLANKEVKQIQNLRLASAVLGNEFVEHKNNTIRRARDYKVTKDTLLGDRNIKLSNISQFAGIENGKLKIGRLENFNDTTTIIPVRNKNIGRVTKIIKLKETYPNYNKMVDEKFPPIRSFKWIFMSPKKRKEYRNKRINYYNLLASSKAPSPYNNERVLLRAINERGDTITLDNTFKHKMIFGDEVGNSIFINKLSDDKVRDILNRKLSNTPLYPMILDNGRYSHYDLDGNVAGYVNPLDNRESMYIIGYKNGGKLSKKNK